VCARARELLVILSLWNFWVASINEGERWLRIFFSLQNMG